MLITESSPDIKLDINIHSVSLSCIKDNQKLLDTFNIDYATAKKDYEKHNSIIIKNKKERDQTNNNNATNNSTNNINDQNESNNILQTMTISKILI